jgi:hypothetical protein
MLDGTGMVTLGFGGLAATAGAAAAGVNALARPDREYPNRAYLASGHAHNDYKHLRPLHTALRYGYASVEADVFPVDGELLVGHGRGSVAAHRTLRALYLEPLAERVRRCGSVYPGRSLQLLVELKGDPKLGWEIIAGQLDEYADLLTRYDRGTIHQGPVTVVLTGAGVPVNLIAAEPERLAFCDGTLSFMDDYPADVVPLVSERWLNHFRWYGLLPLAGRHRKALHAMVSRVHAAGRLMRFYALPRAPRYARRAAWREMTAAGVDYISVDRLRGYAAYCRMLTVAPAGRAA